MYKCLAICGFFLLIIWSAFRLYQIALISPVYEGLPTVPCFDTTQPVRQNYSLHIAININHQPYLLDARIGHDYGKCLHTIFTNDSSGTVYVRANDSSQYTLGQFFDVWHKTFTYTQIMAYPITTAGNMRIFVNEKEVTTGRLTLLQPGASIIVTYQ